MKKIILGIALFYASTLFAQQPETVYSIALEVRELPWYEQQMDLWEKETKKNPKDGNAWTNYYMASRALKNLTADEPEKQAVHVKKCTAILEACKKADPKSFEAYYLAYLDAGFKNPEESLLKAAAIKPFDNRILDEMMIHNLLKFDEKGFETYCTKMVEINHLPAGILNWGHNILAELDQNALLFTFGDNDTYGAWINQGAFGFRKDVTVINTYLLQDDAYRTKLFQKIGLPPFNVKLTDVSVEEFNRQLIQHILDGQRPVYVANTGVANFPEAFKENLYLTGLTHRYSKSALETEATIVRNFEKRYLLDYLSATFSHHIADAKTVYFNESYLPMLIKLYKHYCEVEDVEKQTKVKTLLTSISSALGKEQEVLELLSK
ncbi:MAG: hypothetical protein IT221_00135 [Fluviicola sp.]|nr:hypothetical protein [Fluviicola sp.]